MIFLTGIIDEIIGIFRNVTTSTRIVFYKIYLSNTIYKKNMEHLKEWASLCRKLKHKKYIFILSIGHSWIYELKSRMLIVFTISENEHNTKEVSSS